MTEQRAFVIGQRELDEISAFCDIATANRSLLTLSELVELTAADASEEDFETAWKNNRFLDSKFALESGYVVERLPETSLRTRVEDGNRGRARRNSVLASEFASLCKGQGVRLIAISGGNSYRSARREDDIDLFCVTAKNAMWLFMLKSLLLARFYKLARKSPPFCFSYVVEDEVALSEFHEPKDALFARDALSARVLLGGGFYQRLLEGAGWMKGYFPRLYSERTSIGRAAEQKGGPKGTAVLNHFLYLTVGSYVRMKAGILNRKYKSRGQEQSVFQPRIGKDHCIYESNRYRRLRRMYAGVGGETAD